MPLVCELVEAFYPLMASPPLLFSFGDCFFFLCRGIQSLLAWFLAVFVFLGLKPLVCVCSAFRALFRIRGTD